MAASSSLVFSAPRLITDETNASGPWWQGIHALSDKHALGWVPARMVATNDGGESWRTLLGWKDKETDAFGGVSAIDGTSFHDCGANHTFLSPTGSNINVTGIRARQTNRFSLSESGDFVRAQGRPFTICGLPNVDYFRVGAGGSSIWLRDGRTMLATAVTSGVGSAESRSRHKLSIVALRSGDQGYTWSYSGLVASADEVPSAHEGPSENALARLTNGSLIVVFRVAGENGHHSPYHSKISDDDGASWAYLRPLRRWPGSSVAPGCVLPRLIALEGGALVLAGGRPSPSSHDVLIWLNAAGDGDMWRPYSVSYWHDQLMRNRSWLIPGAAINRSWPRYSTSYTSLLRTGSSMALVVYGAGPHGFAMPLRLVRP